MNDFSFLENPVTGKWVVLAPRRAKRPDASKGPEPVCPFCVGREGDEEEVYRVPLPVIPNSIRDLPPAGGQVQNSGEMLNQVQHDKKSDWAVRVIPNKFPFAPTHEIIIHSPDHHKNFGELDTAQVKLILQTYRHRYNEHSHKGQVYIFHNRGQKGGESLPHPHTQLVVIPDNVTSDIPPLGSVFPNVILSGAKDLGSKDRDSSPSVLRDQNDTYSINTDQFILFCPQTSQWPDEVWVAPKTQGRAFGEITDPEISDLADILNSLVKILSLRHGPEFPFNFYLYPGGDWYLRFIPREKSLGGFEVGAGIFVNTQDPEDSLSFLKKHFTSS